MKYEIEISGYGPIEDICTGLELILRALKDERVRDKMDCENILDLDGSEWRDNTLHLDIKTIQQ